MRQQAYSSMDQNSQEQHELIQQKFNISILCNIQLGCEIPQIEGSSKIYDDSFGEKKYLNIYDSFEEEFLNCPQQVLEQESRVNFISQSKVIASATSQFQENLTQQFTLTRKEQTQKKLQNQILQEKQCQLVLKQDEINIIQVSEKKMLAREAVLMGSYLDSKPISRILFAMLKKHLIQLYRRRIFTSVERQILAKFIESNPTMEEIIKIFQSQKIRLKCLQFLSSSDAIKKCLSSSRMQFRTKLQALKFFQRMRKLALTKAEREVHFKKLHWRAELTSINTFNSNQVKQRRQTK